MSHASRLAFNCDEHCRTPLIRQPRATRSSCSLGPEELAMSKHQNEVRATVGVESGSIRRPRKRNRAAGSMLLSPASAPKVKNLNCVDAGLNLTERR